MTVWAKESKILLPIVQPIPITMIHIQYQRLTFPFWPQPTLLT